MNDFAEFQALLKTCRPFVPSSQAQGALTGLVYWYVPTASLLCASSHFGGIICFMDADEEFYEKALFFPWDVVDSFIDISLDQAWKKFQALDNGQYEVHIGNVKLTFAARIVLEPGICDIPGGEVLIPDDFKLNMQWISPFMCHDDIKLNMYGMFVGEDGLYASNNFRMVFRKSEVPKPLENTFLPRKCVDIVKNNAALNYVMASDKVFIFS